MKILSLEFEEFLDTPKEWKVNKFNLQDINLIVGLNASGKTRLLSVINGLSEYFYNPSKKAFDSGKFNILFETDREKMLYKVEFKDKKVVSELLKKGKVVLLKRDSSGTGLIKAEKVAGKDKIGFHISEELLAVSAKRDQLQHSFLEKLFDWGNKLTFFPFGSTMGQTELKPLEIREGKYNINIRDYKEYIGKFIKGKETYHEEYVNSIINDMKKIDYDIRGINLVPVEFLLPINSKKILALQITEEEIGIIVDQISLSQGMFRAFSLIIQLNYLIFEDIKGGTILIDDIGEGLDYDRSIKLIKLIIEKLEGTENQLIMTTNDRFVMNNTPIEYWNILNRKGHIVEVINYKNSKSIFNDFYKSGLSNFDFFSSKFYLGESQNN